MGGAPKSRSVSQNGSAPLIGLSTSELRTIRTLRPIKYGEPSPREYALGAFYVQAIEMAGGWPVIIPPLSETELRPLIGRLDGVCLPGGPDLDPSTYGAEEHEQLGPYDADVDRFELRLIRCADELELPILAICRGAQALNVSRGGTLIQHLPDLGSGVEHRQKARGNQTSHSVTIEPDSRLAEIVGGTSLEVNSFHHQGIARIGRNLRAVAHAPDEAIEGLEADDREFCLAVQWHAETLVDQPPHAALFNALIEAATDARVRV